MKKTRTISLDEEVWRSIKMTAVQNNITMAEVIEHLVLNARVFGEDERGKKL